MKKSFAFLAALLVFLPGLAVGQEEKPEEEAGAKTGLNARTFAGLKLRCIGPAMMSGRIADIAVHPGDQSTWYVAVGSGNLWKTENAGSTWTPIFENQGSYSLGCVTIDPGNPNIVWVGAGENVSGRHVGYGDGVYKSLDGGKSWDNMGLKASEHIGRIAVDPRDSDVVYVAAEGPLWTPGGERGLFKTADGGKTWTLSLEIGENTGTTDVAFDPRDPDVLYAAAYQRRRNVAAFLGGGPESGIFKSEDAGATWRRLKRGLPSGDVGKIGLAVSPQNPDVVYATVEAAGDSGGFFRSTDRGESWEKRGDYLSGGTGPHYYQEIYADPHRFDCVYQMDVRMMVTEDGGRTFRPVGENLKHGDNHALAFDPNDRDYLLAGADGGLYESWDRGANWKFISNLPVTQFYKLAVDYDEPFYNVIGGTQDNNTQLGPSRTAEAIGILNSDWTVTCGGDGYTCRIDPNDPGIIYCESQNGNLVRYDKSTGEGVSIRPEPEPGEDPARPNWDAPIFISPHDNKRLYYGFQRLYRSDDRGDSWRPVSPDLSRGQGRTNMPIMGRAWGIEALYDYYAMSMYANITSVSESPLQEGLIYCGTDDGLIQVTEDGGRNWRKIDKFPGVPEFTFVNEVTASLHDAGTVFATFVNHKRGDFKPYILKSADRGSTWQSIAGDLPDRHLVWCLAEDQVKKDLLFVGTEFGVFFTIDGGVRWIKLTGDVPTIPFRDIEVQQRESDLVCASFGRGFYILDDYSPLRLVSEEGLEQEAILFPVKKALIYAERRGTPDSQGAMLFAAPNPPFGAVITYYLKESLETRKQARLKSERKIAKEGGDVLYPTLEDLKLEAREDRPAVILTIEDEEGNVVRRLTGPPAAGIHRVAWDLRYASLMPVSGEETERGMRRFMLGGPMVVPGAYTVSMAKYQGGEQTALAEPQTIRVVPLGYGRLPEQDQAEVNEFCRKVAGLQRVMMGAMAAAREAEECLGALQRALAGAPGENLELLKRAKEMELALLDLQDELTGYRGLTGRSWGEPMPTSIYSRLMTAARGTYGTYGPTVAHRRNYELAAEAFPPLLEKLRELIDVELQQLEEEVEAAGAPWTKGRGVPKWEP